MSNSKVSRTHSIWRLIAVAGWLALLVVVVLQCRTISRLREEVDALRTQRPVALADARSRPVPAAAAELIDKEQLQKDKRELLQLRNEVRQLRERASLRPVDSGAASDNVRAHAEMDSEPGFEGKRLTEWIVSFDQKTPRIEREQASRAVRAMGKKAVPHLIAMLTGEHDQGTSDNTQQWRAIHALIYLGPEAEASIPVLIRCLGWSDEEIQLQAVVALGEIGKEPEAVVPALEKMLTSPSARLRMYSIMSLWGGFKTSDPARSAIEKALHDSDERVREMASRALAGDNPDLGATQ